MFENIDFLVLVKTHLLGFLKMGLVVGSKKKVLGRKKKSKTKVVMNQIADKKNVFEKIADTSLTKKNKKIDM